VKTTPGIQYYHVSKIEQYGLRFVFHEQEWN
jgi:hypothetical protein